MFAVVHVCDYDMEVQWNNTQALHGCPIMAVAGLLRNQGVGAQVNGVMRSVGTERLYNTSWPNLV